MRVARTVAAVTLTGGLVAGCGSGGTKADQSQPTAAPVVTQSATPSSTPSDTATASGSPSASATPTKKISTAEAEKLAAAGVLVAGDMSGYTGAAQQKADASDVAANHALFTCLGIAYPTYLHRNYGTAFTAADKSNEVDTSADVVASSAEAGRELAALRTDKGAGCFGESTKASLVKSGAKSPTVNFTLVDASVAGSEATFAYKFTYAVTTPSGTVNATGYLLGVQVGQTEISLSIDSTNGTAVTLDAIEKLAATLIPRIKTAEV